MPQDHLANQKRRRPAPKPNSQCRNAD